MKFTDIKKHQYLIGGIVLAAVGIYWYNNRKSATSASNTTNFDGWNNAIGTATKGTPSASKLGGGACWAKGSNGEWTIVGYPPCAPCATTIKPSGASSSFTGGYANQTGGVVSDGTIKGGGKAVSIMPCADLLANYHHWVGIFNAVYHPSGVPMAIPAGLTRASIVAEANYYAGLLNANHCCGTNCAYPIIAN